MSELGRLLRETRFAKELGLSDVEAVTRIRQKYLLALENGQFNELPRGTVARGFLRTYAQYLGLDVASVLELYTRESGDSGMDIPIAEPGKPRLVDYRPLEVELSDGPAVPRVWPWLLVLALLAALVGGGWWFLSRNPGWNPLVAFGPAPTATFTPTKPSTPWVVTATPGPTATATPTLSLPTPTSDLLTLPTPTVPASPTPTPRPTLTPEIVPQIALELRVTQRAWVRVTVDGVVVEEAILEPETIRAWEANTSITVRTGNGSGVNLTLNGQLLGAMGNPDEVVERIWIVDQGEVTEATGEPPTSTPAPTFTPTPAG